VASPSLAAAASSGERVAASNSSRSTLMALGQVAAQVTQTIEGSAAPSDAQPRTAASPPAGGERWAVQPTLADSPDARAAVAIARSAIESMQPSTARDTPAAKGDAKVIPFPRGAEDGGAAEGGSAVGARASKVTRYA